METNKELRCPEGDHTLLHRFRRGEGDAATEIYLRYAQRLRALASNKTPPALSPRFDADDVVQSVFRTLFRRVTEGMYDVPPGDELWQLLLVIALNKIRGLAIHHRAQKRDAGRTHSIVAAMSRPPAIDDQTSIQVLAWVIDDVLDGLPESNRQIVRLRIQGHRAVDIADRTERSQRTVERVLRDFRVELSSKIDDAAKG